MRKAFVVFSTLFLLATLAFLLTETENSTAQDSQTTDADVIDPDPVRPFVMPESGPFHSEKIAVENNAAISAWVRSGHSDIRSESFSHWNDAGEIPPVCSVCHSGAGFRAFHGLDGGTPGIPENPLPTGGVVDCATCHNPRLAEVGEIRLPSGTMHPVAGVEAACLTCHQGRAAGATIEAAIGARSADTPDPELSFINPHYATAAASWLGGYGAAGYHYPDKTYSGRFFHARPVATCVSCHDPHSLEVAASTCLTCHEKGEPREIRISRLSYDGSGDISVGIRSDIEANARRLHEMLIAYARQVAGTPLVYDGHRHPYFFSDANGDGSIDMANGRAVGYNAWTPRLLRAAYNWKLVTADPGAYAHNPHYALELLYDSIEDLAPSLDIDMAELGLER